MNISEYGRRGGSALSDSPLSGETGSFIASGNARARFGVFREKLTASGGDIPTFAMPDRSRVIPLDQHVLKRRHRRFVRPAKSASGVFVERDKVHLASHAMKLFVVASGINKSSVYDVRRYK